MIQEKAGLVNHYEELEDVGLAAECREAHEKWNRGEYFKKAVKLHQVFELELLDRDPKHEFQQEIHVRHREKDVVPRAPLTVALLRQLGGLVHLEIPDWLGVKFAHVVGSNQVN